MLVTRFVLGLKDEIRAVVMVQLPTIVTQAAEIAWAQEEVLASLSPKLQKKPRRFNLSAYWIVVLSRKGMLPMSRYT
ncbi:hypothetical protein E2562_021903 [Oryza meyeriana var. granulata]|uniref:Uncharacterized protein n=1 Tax=Oryza meyeriana var. granulata TaxID=110450 RepID=A0A6G1C839_9ORYZ|nr:hypothetical protein E2562_021903 [Oryza meyeriana var. granulata]